MSKRPTAGRGGKPAKKVRIASPDEEGARFEATVDDALEAAPQRGRVKADGFGYDSDSTDDGEGVVRSRTAGGAADDDDMFADGPPAEDASGKKKKKASFLALGDIEGQEFSDGDGEDGASEDSADAEDEDDAARIRAARAHAGMGFELSGFNMKAEMDEGKFAADGTFVRAFDPHAAHDRWLDGTDEREIRRARKAARARAKREAAAQAREDGAALRREERELALVQLLRPSETVLEALQRLGAEERRRKAVKGKARAAGTAPAAPSDIERVTELASELMQDNVDIYSTTYEALLRSVRRAGVVADDWTPPDTTPRYEYRWAGGDGAVFGPFTEAEMREWHGADYFGPSADKIDVRPVLDKVWGTWDAALGNADRTL